MVRDSPGGSEIVQKDPSICEDIGGFMRVQVAPEGSRRVKEDPRQSRNVHEGPKAQEGKEESR